MASDGYRHLKGRERWLLREDQGRGAARSSNIRGAGPQKRLRVPIDSFFQ
jgi:hypothetical protein